MSAAATLGLKMQVSPDTWKGASAHNMKLSQAIIARCDQGIMTSRQTDPLPLLRDACIRESNVRIHTYVRATRAVVVQLRQKLVATNEEIKALTRGKEALERALEHTRKDLALNRQSLELRGLRPAREKVGGAAHIHVRIYVRTTYVCTYTYPHLQNGEGLTIVFLLYRSLMQRTCAS